MVQPPGPAQNDAHPAIDAAVDGTTVGAPGRGGADLQREERGADLAALYDSCGAAVYRLAVRLLGSAAEAEDLTHDVFLRFWRQDRYDPRRGPVLAYLLLLTRSMALNRLRQRSNRQGLLMRWRSQWLPRAGGTPEEVVERDQLAERVRRALAAIPASQRQVLELAYYGGLSQSAIGERLQLPLGTVKSRSRQGLIRLRALLIDEHDQP